METTLQVLRAAAESSRLRLLALLAGGEVSVGELVIALEQSQPRVSRHLKLLKAAGLIESFRDNHHIYYRLTTEASTRELLGSLLSGLDDDAAVQSDRDRLMQARQQKEKQAYRKLPPARTLRMGSRQPAEAQVIEAAIDEVLRDIEPGDFLNIRTGSGHLLRHIAPRAKSATGVDRSEAMRLLARSAVQQAGLAECTLRNVDGKTLPFEPRSFDTVLLNEALGRTTDKRQALSEAVRVLRPSGCLLIIDWVEQVALQNTGSANRADTDQPDLAENQLRALLAEQGLAVRERSWLPGKSPNYGLFVAVSANALKTGAA